MRDASLYVLPLPVQREVVALTRRVEQFVVDGRASGLSDARLVTILDEENDRARTSGAITPSMAIDNAVSRARAEALGDRG